MTYRITEIIKWFNNNYIEEKLTIFKILEEASIKHACNFKTLFESCRIIKQAYPEKTSIGRVVQQLIKLADNGIIGQDAGRKLMSYGSADQAIRSETN